MTPETRIKRIQQFIERMPSLSTTVAKVLEICNNPGASANDLNRVISYDPVLTGQMLKLINSAYYGLPNRITTLTRAIIMLGVNTVKNLVLATSVLAGCRGISNIKPIIININDFWAHCLCAGVLSKLIAELAHVPLVEQEEYFVAGLLHDLGKLPMMACFSELYRKSVSTAKQADIRLVESETLHIGFNHCQVGVLIAAKWNLGLSMQEAISRHHEQENNSAAGFFVNSIGVANCLANHFSVGTAGDPFEPTFYLKNHADAIDVPVENLMGLKSQMEGEIEKARMFLQIAEKGSLP